MELSSLKQNAVATSSTTNAWVSDALLLQKFQAVRGEVSLRVPERAGRLVVQEADPLLRGHSLLHSSGPIGCLHPRPGGHPGADLLLQEGEAERRPDEADR